MDKISRAEQLEQKRSYWKQHIDSWQETGLTQAEYCRQHNLKPHQLVYWKKRYLKTETDVSFVPLNLEDLLDSPAEPDHSALSLILNNQFKIQISAGFDAKLLRQLIFALRGLRDS
ncbi:MAG: transposase [Deltaproteobacteria bacterium]